MKKRKPKTHYETCICGKLLQMCITPNCHFKRDHSTLQQCTECYDYDRYEALAKTQQIDGEGCFQQARTKARYGHKRWIVWRDNQDKHAARLTAETVKKALLSRKPWLIVETDGTTSLGFWSLGINLINQAKRGTI